VTVLDVARFEAGVGRADAVLGVPLRDVPAVQAQLAGDHLLGEVPLADKEGDDVHLVALHGAEHLPEVGLFLPERLPDLVERARLADRVRVVEGGRTGVRV